MRRYFISPSCSKSECHLYNNCRKLPTEVHTDESEEIDILLVGHCGGKNESDRGIPFVGKAGNLLRSIVEWLAKKYDLRFAYSTVVRGCLKNEENEDRPPEHDEIINCLPLLLSDINRIKPKIIVTLGKSATDAFVRNADEIFLERGRIFTTEYGTVIPTIHPAMILSSHNVLSLIFEDIQRAALVAKGKLSIPQNYDKIGEAVLLDTVPQVKDFVDFLLNDLDEESVIATDTETSNLNKKYGNRVATIQIAYDTDTGYMIPYQHKDTPFSIGELAQVKDHLKRLYNDKSAKFKYHVMHNATYDEGRIYNEMGFWITNKPTIDTMVMAFLLDENKWKAVQNTDKVGAYKLKYLSREWFNFTHYHKGILAEREEGSLADLPLKGTGADSLVGYGCMDVYCTQRVYRVGERMLKSLGCYKSTMRLLEHLYSPAYRMIANMEINGFKVDTDFLHILQSPESPIGQKLDEIIEKFKEMETVQKANEIVASERVNGDPTFFTPWLFDLNKRDCIETLFGKVMELDAPKSKKTGSPSYGRPFYSEIEGQYQEVDLFAEYKGLSKLDTSYCNPINNYINQDLVHTDKKFQQKQIDGCDGRLRGSFWFTGTVTGRSSSSDFNLQNQPRGDNDYKKMIKNLFCAEPGNAIVQLDAQTAEVRWWCLLSKDPMLAKGFNDAFKYIEMFRKDPNPEYKALATLYGDFHKVTASMMFGVPIEEVTPEQRQAAKNIVFGLIYGRGTKSIAKQIKKTIEQTQVLVDKFFERFPVGTKYLQNLEQFGRQNLYVESPIGRKRRLPFFLFDEMDNHSKNQSVNSPVQGISSDATLVIGSSLMTDYIVDNNKPWKPVDIVHDSFDSEVPYDDIIEYVYTAEEKFTTGVVEKMNKVFGFEFVCPLAVDFEIGNKWGDVKKWNGTPAHLDEIIDWVKHN
jgi:DNA polymerase-1